MAHRDADEAMWQQRVWHRLQLIEALDNHLGGRHWDLAQTGSELASDDSLTDPFQTSHIVGHCLSFSLDCLRTTRMILVDPNADVGIRLPVAGHYPALRSAMESGAEAIWLLGPDERQERVARTLRARWEDVLQDNGAVLALTEPVPSDARSEIAHKNKLRKTNSANVRAKKGGLREVAKRAGVSEEVMLEGLPGYGPMLLEAASETGVKSNHQYGMWRLVSGLTHPSTSRSHMMSVVDDLSPDDSKLMRAELTASVSLTNTAIDAALLLHWRALALAERRGGLSGLSFRPPDGFPLPPGYEQISDRA